MGARASALLDKVGITPVAYQAGTYVLTGDVYILAAAGKIQLGGVSAKTSIISLAPVDTMVAWSDGSAARWRYYNLSATGIYVFSTPSACYIASPYPVKLTLNGRILTPQPEWVNTAQIGVACEDASVTVGALSIGGAGAQIQSPSVYWWDLGMLGSLADGGSAFIPVTTDCIYDMPSVTQDPTQAFRSFTASNPITMNVSNCFTWGSGAVSPTLAFGFGGVPPPSNQAMAPAWLMLGINVDTAENYSNFDLYPLTLADPSWLAIMTVGPFYPSGNTDGSIPSIWCYANLPGFTTYPNPTGSNVFVAGALFVQPNAPTPPTLITPSVVYSQSTQVYMRRQSQTLWGTAPRLT